MRVLARAHQLNKEPAVAIDILSRCVSGPSNRLDRPADINHALHELIGLLISSEQPGHLTEAMRLAKQHSRLQVYLNFSLLPYLLS